MGSVDVQTNEADISKGVILPPDLQGLSTLLDENPESLATGNSAIQAAALNVTKRIFDLSVDSEVISRPHVNDLITSLAPSQAPQTRSKIKVKSQKDAAAIVPTHLFKFTPINTLFVDGMDEEQIWAQLDIRTKTICKVLDFVLEGELSDSGDAVLDDYDVDDQEEEEEEGLEGDDNLRKALKALEEDHHIDLDEFLAKYGLQDSEVLSDSQEGEEGDDDSEEDSDSEVDASNFEEEGITPLRDASSDEESESEVPQQTRKTLPSPSRKKKRKNNHPELDDGFFDLSEFNAETERAESKSTSRGRLSGENDSEDEEMDIDLFASVEEDAESDDELFYRDFFDPPSRPATSNYSTKPKQAKQKNQVHFHDEVRVKKIKATGKNRPLDDEEDEDLPNDHLEGSELDESEEFDDGDEEVADKPEESDHSSNESQSVVDDNATIQRLKDDLFADEDDKIQNDMTTHEKRMASLREQISELESENVAPKEWVLMGEAASRQRPQNSLLEEDLEFERVMKAVPVVTEEVVKSLEEKIKGRILEGRFDDVVRIRLLEDKPFLPSRLLELQDTKSTQSLAQIYENDYIASQTGETTDDRDGKLQKEHDEITLLWDKICGKLDALCNAHYVPKQPKATISTVTNTPTATLESALPTSQSTSTMLTPEEVFSAPSSLRSRSELTPAEKRALRTKERKTRKRQRDALERSVDKFAKSKGIGGVKRQKQAALESVAKHGKGVTVVGKKPSTAGLKKGKRRT
ncbi:U3 small nucleolar ribonucleoprotein complex, subunit Mpp10 [Gymnopilus junonius]|uniref:U3 small nucleolar ribonucleoprotein protein MPP10 n=1 Tax=Gymnopilus junonius TaxID=109634 RepID=A0A9P5P2Y6_GYMJU|nr:U3 small nucleolar ribonucleoprotein complex, subunit Mpp10 [Gymnopilus junonius]